MFQSKAEVKERWKMEISLSKYWKQNNEKYEMSLLKNYSTASSGEFLSQPFSSH